MAGGCVTRRSPATVQQCNHACCIWDSRHKGVSLQDQRDRYPEDHPFSFDAVSRSPAALTVPTHPTKESPMTRRISLQYHHHKYQYKYYKYQGYLYLTPTIHLTSHVHPKFGAFRDSSVVFADVLEDVCHSGATDPKRCDRVRFYHDWWRAKRHREHC